MLMKINSRPLKRAGNHRQQGFTLIEMIGVLAVIAILAAVLVPKVFEAINNAKVNNAAMTCQTVKTAIADHYAKFGSLAVDGRGTTPAPFTVATNIYDDILVGEGFLDKPFATKIGDGTVNTTVRLDLAEGVGAAPAASTAAGGTGDAAYNLDGDSTAATYNKATGSSVVHAIITGVTLNDARDLNARIDGTAVALGEGGPLGSSVTATATDLAGRVKYKFTGGATTTVYVYLTHR